ncbi:MAG TPA: M48 family metallopeptidase [Candidatus Paceibacterota bacterium]
MASLYTHQSENVRKTFILMGGFLIFLIALGWIFSQALASPAILYFAIVLAIVMNLISYWHSDKIALALSGAKVVTREEQRELYRTIENLCITAGLPLPRIYVIDAPQINAFATGRDKEHSAIAVTSGALQKLSQTELEGVLAHELSHIGNRDILVATVVVVLAGIIALMSDFFMRSLWFGGGSRGRNREGGGIFLVIGLLSAIIAPITATLIKLAISRQREFLADASGTLLTRYPEGLASALEKIEADMSTLPKARSGTAHLYISNPFKGTKVLNKLFMTHPPLTERILRLRGGLASSVDER